MIEYYGWATIREAYCEQSENRQELHKIVQSFTEIFNRAMKATNANGALEQKNGEWRFMVFGARNHRSGDWPHIFEMYRWLSLNALGSYGILMIHDDEMPEEENEFITFVLRKGHLVKEKDRYLSPYFSKVEDV